MKKKKTVHCPRLSDYVINADMEPWTWNYIHHLGLLQLLVHYIGLVLLLVHHRLLSNSEDTAKVDDSWRYQEVQQRNLNVFQLEPLQSIKLLRAAKINLGNKKHRFFIVQIFKIHSSILKTKRSSELILTVLLLTLGCIVSSKTYTFEVL